MAEKNPIVTIVMNDGDVMKLELYPEVAENTVNNFISLVNKGFYDGLTFHRIISGFMIQGGDPDGKMYKLMSFAGSDRDVADPWYTRNFEVTYRDVEEGCKGLLAFLVPQK